MKKRIPNKPDFGTLRFLSLINRPSSSALAIADHRRMEIGFNKDADFKFTEKFQHYCVETAEAIITHETVHLVLYKEVGEKASGR